MYVCRLCLFFPLLLLFIRRRVMIKSGFRGKLWFGSSGRNENRRNQMQARYCRLMCLSRNVRSVFEKEPKVTKKKWAASSYFCERFRVSAFVWKLLLETGACELSTQQTYSNDFSWWPWNSTHFGTLRDHSFVKSHWKSHKRMFQTGDVCILHGIPCFFSYFSFMFEIFSIDITLHYVLFQLQQAHNHQNENMRCQTLCTVSLVQCFHAAKEYSINIRVTCSQHATHCEYFFIFKHFLRHPHTIDASVSMFQASSNNHPHRFCAAQRTFPNYERVETPSFVWLLRSFLFCTVRIQFQYFFPSIFYF